jgi:hypothetical protein
MPTKFRKNVWIKRGIVFILIKVIVKKKLTCLKGVLEAGCYQFFLYPGKNHIIVPKRNWGFSG